QDVFKAFSRTLDSSSKAGSKEEGTASKESPDVVAALRVLSKAPTGHMALPEFADLLPGDQMSSLTAAIELMKRGLITMDTQERNAVRITDVGRTVSGLTSSA
ncbi:MAG TPA: hypothetical protein VF686_03605, partial [Brevundimonas sp.]